LIQAFVNTADLEPGIDALGDADALSGWLVARGLMAAGARASEQDLKHSIAVREAIRGAIGANSGRSVYPVDMATLNGAVAASRLLPRFGPDGKSPPRAPCERRRRCARPHRGCGLWRDERGGVEPAQALRFVDLPLGFLRPVP